MDTYKSPTCIVLFHLPDNFVRLVLSSPLYTQENCLESAAASLPEQIGELNPCFCVRHREDAEVLLWACLRAQQELADWLVLGRKRDSGDCHIYCTSTPDGIFIGQTKIIYYTKASIQKYAYILATLLKKIGESIQIPC